MSTLTNIEKLKLEKLFEMEGGYVADFTNRTFSEFVLTCTKKDIYGKQYEYGGDSKANRLRVFWKLEPDKVVGMLLSEMLEYWKTQKLLKEEAVKPHLQLLFEECQGIVGRLLGSPVSAKATALSEDDFIQKEFKNISLSKINLDAGVVSVLELRLAEIKTCLNAKSPLAVIFLCGSSLEGILLGVASNRPKDFNSSPISPKDKSGQVLVFQKWSLSNFIDVSCSLGILGEDVKKFSHALRDFRNYIHPYQQLVSKFNPTEHTAKICWQVLQAVIAQVSLNK